MLKTIHNPDFEIKDCDHNFTYQETLTAKLDALYTDVDQDIINEIVLWKVNRYAYEARFGGIVIQTV